MRSSLEPFLLGIWFALAATATVSLPVISEEGIEPITDACSPQSTATALTFVMLMALNPEKQRLAQAEIDSVTEGLRLPTVADRNRLPYVAALTKEVMRWHAVVPLGED